jgi:CBS domain containing-hemolysin-like protein
LQDEYDPEEPTVLDLGNSEWMVDGRVTVEDLSDHLTIGFPAGEYTTIAGLLLDVAGRIPVAGDTIELDGFTAEVVRMDRNRVDRIKLKRKS